MSKTKPKNYDEARTKILFENGLGFSEFETLAFDLGYLEASKNYADLKMQADALAGQIKCNETFHRLGGIDDCEPCKTLADYQAFLKGSESE